MRRAGFVFFPMLLASTLAITFLILVSLHITMVEYFVKEQEQLQKMECALNALTKWVMALVKKDFEHLYAYASNKKLFCSIDQWPPGAQLSYKGEVAFLFDKRNSLDLSICIKNKQQKSIYKMRMVQLEDSNKNFEIITIT